MSEDPTQISLRTVLEAINSLGVELHNFRVEMREFRDTVEAKLEDMDERLNVLAGDIVKVRAREARTRQLSEQLEAILASREASKSPTKERA